jgi:hypothetical protein
MNRLQAMNTSRKILFATLIFFAGALFAWLLRPESLALPKTAMLLEIANETSKTVPSVEIQYGNQNSQETILALQITPGETRTLTLNHQPGMGFNFTTHINGEEISFCAGKFSKSQGLRQTIKEGGEIDESDL